MLKFLCNLDFLTQHLSAHQDLIKKLLTHDRTKRFGCLKYGADDVKRHKFFRSIDWQLCYSRGMAAPYVPSVKSAEDTSMFDSYPESAESKEFSLALLRYFYGFAVECKLCVLPICAWHVLSLQSTLRL